MYILYLKFILNQDNTYKIKKKKNIADFWNILWAFHIDQVSISSTFFLYREAEEITLR